MGWGTQTSVFSAQSTASSFWALIQSVSSPWEGRSGLRNMQLLTRQDGQSTLLARATEARVTHPSRSLRAAQAERTLGFLRTIAPCFQTQQVPRDCLSLQALHALNRAPVALSAYRFEAKRGEELWMRGSRHPPWRTWVLEQEHLRSTLSLNHWSLPSSLCALVPYGKWGYLQGLLWGSNESG